MTRWVGAWVCWGLLLAGGLSSCGREQSFTLPFRAVVGSQPLQCGEPYSGVGTTQSTLELMDFRLYVSDVQLVDSQGTKHALRLDDDGEWQHSNIALLDFQNAQGLCDKASPSLRTKITGQAPRQSSYQAIELTLGIPESLNHLDSAVAEPPLNIPALWWSWKGGYKFMKLDLRTTGNPEYVVHLGADGCTGSTEEGWRCRATNQATFRLEGFDPDTSTVVFDISALLAKLDLNADIDMTTDHIHGCMSAATDPECAPIFESLGLPSSRQPTPAPQTFVRLE